SINFDIKMLQAQGMRFAQPAYDTFDLATLLMPQAPAYRLSTLAATLGIAHDEAHRAHSDADVTRQVFLHLLKRIEALDLQELSEISRLTARMSWSVRDLFGEVERAKAKLVFVESQAPSAEDAEALPIDTTQNPKSKIFIPLKPTGNTDPIDVADVHQFFAPDGALGQTFEGYEQRAQQVEMSEAVARALNQGDNLMVEAGTGTGKGLAYLVPSAIFAAQRGERVVVSTNTINLQDQLFFKDIPDLQRIMSGSQELGDGGQRRASSQSLTPDSQLPFTAALLKGRGNYLCLRRYKALRRDDRLQDEEVRTLLKVQLWLPTTNTGDKAELLLMDRENTAWGRINVTPETCIGPRCPDFDECFFFKARKQAEAAHLVVVNHALMLADLASEANVLPPYDHLVIDEAHNLEDVATDQFGFSVDQTKLLIFLDDLFQSGGANISGGLVADLPKHFRESAASQGDMDKATAIAQGVGPAVTRAR
ncbi:MAG TPA: DNA polymerase III subunit epsilon, partial [Roseiflexaceae bacterium]|nr:DNA polymerase III subunit epsilon [Roseiflexaceae bacterium]